jgi:maltose phosphorylase
VKDHYYQPDPWKIIESSFDPERQEGSESIFSIGNGRMGQRANFEEDYSGDSLQGSYIAGVYYPDKTRVGWWKNGYPEYFAKVLNAANWIGIRITINGQPLDLAKMKVLDFYRELDMKRGLLIRKFTAQFPNGHEVEVQSTRFCSMVDDECGAIEYTIKTKDKKALMFIEPYIDFDVINTDSNYDEKFWAEVGKDVESGRGYCTARTKKLDFQVCSGMTHRLFVNEEKVSPEAETIEREKYISNAVDLSLEPGDKLTIHKFAANLSSENHEKEKLAEHCYSELDKCLEKGFDMMLREHAGAWEKKWERSDIIIEGDVAAQQGIRFNIFQLNQTYTGEDDRLNIGPKGFTGEKYGGSTYWDTEAYCLHFYLCTTEKSVARQLLVYRYKHLQKAIENAEKLGFKNGAALYPMVTMNGEECHNEWEITFEEIHRNGAIARAIYDYVNYTGGEEYIAEYGLEVLIGISRFWKQRVNWSEDKKKFVMLGVTGPNEYENNINNNWYTNKMAHWTLSYTMDQLKKRKGHPEVDAMLKRINFDEKEIEDWKEVVENLYFPESKELGVFLQQDGFLDKEQIMAADIPEAERPINQNWSWDRILRSCFIKQADTLQGIYVFEDEYDLETIRRNFDFYEPRTVHESSLSPCIHSILACKLGKKEKAYEMYLRTSRLDLDDYNREVDEGLHITSMAGTWMSVVEGFGGMRVLDGELHLNPVLPEEWKSLSFMIRFREAELKITVNKDSMDVENHSDHSIQFECAGSIHQAEGNNHISVSLNN